MSWERSIWRPGKIGQSTMANTKCVKTKMRLWTERSRSEIIQEQTSRIVESCSAGNCASCYTWNKLKTRETRETADLVVGWLNWNYPDDSWNIEKSPGLLRKFAVTWTTVWYENMSRKSNTIWKYIISIGC